MDFSATGLAIGNKQFPPSSTFLNQGNDFDLRILYQVNLLTNYEGRTKKKTKHKLKLSCPKSSFLRMLLENVDWQNKGTVPRNGSRLDLLTRELIQRSGGGEFQSGSWDAGLRATHPNKDESCERVFHGNERAPRCASKWACWRTLY